MIRGRSCNPSKVDILELSPAGVSMSWAWVFATTALVRPKAEKRKLSLHLMRNHGARGGYSGSNLGQTQNHPLWESGYVSGPIGHSSGWA